MRPYEPPPKPKYDIIYYSGNELPKTEDVGGAEAGRSGRAGGREAFHPTQTIRVARGSTVRETVADAPKLESSGIQFRSRQPARAQGASGPCSGGRHAIFPARSLIDPDGGSACSAGARQLRAAPSLNPGAVPPSAAVPQREVAMLHLPGSQPVQVVPPTVSAPEQMTNMNPRLCAAGPSVVAPAPTVTREVTPMGPGFGPISWRNRSSPRRSRSGIRRNVGQSAVWAARPSSRQQCRWARVRRNAPWRGEWARALRWSHRLPPSQAGGSLRPGQRQSRRRIWRSPRRRPGRAPPSSNGGGSSSGVVRFQPARIESRHARQWRQRRSGDVPCRRRQTWHRRLGRRRRNRPRRWPRQRIFWPRIRRGQRRHRPGVRSECATEEFRPIPALEAQEPGPTAPRHAGSFGKGRQAIS